MKHWAISAVLLAASKPLLVLLAGLRPVICWLIASVPAVAHPAFLWLALAALVVAIVVTAALAAWSLLGWPHLAVAAR